MSTQEIDPLSVKRSLGLILLSAALVLIPSIITSKRITVEVPKPSISLGRIEPTAEATSIQDLLVDKPVEEPTPEVIAEKPPEPVQAVVEQKTIVTPPPAEKPVTEPPVAPKPTPKNYPMPEDQAKAFIYQKESGNNPAAVNKSSGACGLGQSLPCSKMASVCPNWRTDYECQDRWFTGYMQNRYGSWSKAVSFWKCTGQCGSTYKKATWW